MKFFKKNQQQQKELDVLLSMLKQILANESLLLTKENMIMNTLDDVIANVAAEDTAIDSAVALIQGLQVQIAALKVGADPTMQAKIDALNLDITNRKVALVAAVATGSPVVTITGPSKVTWSLGGSYKKGDIVLAADGQAYVSTQDNNTGNTPSAGSTFWTPSSSSSAPASAGGVVLTPMTAAAAQVVAAKAVADQPPVKS